ncbi:MAG: hypothetical protein KIT58_00150 [Planctomycetota bacterium]|nr:hypothetical protein [Planctomycetota bacterium]
MSLAWIKALVPGMILRVLEERGITSGGVSRLRSTAQGVEVSGGDDLLGDATVRGLVALGRWGWLGPAHSGGYGVGLLNAPATAGTAATVLHGDGMMRTFVSATTLDAQAYLASQPGTAMIPAYRPLTLMHFALRSAASVRFFAGYAAFDASSTASTATLALSAAAPAQRRTGVMFDTSRPDSTFQWVESDGENQVLTDTGVTPDTDATYWLDLDVRAANDVRMRLLSGRRGAVLAQRNVTSAVWAADSSLLAMIGARNLEAGAARTIGHLCMSQVERPW